MSHLAKFVPLLLLLAFLTSKFSSFVVAQDVEQLRLSAEQGDVNAQYRLSTLYVSGTNDLNQDKLEAVKWCRLAAEQGLSEAQYSLGNMYYTGYGVPQDVQGAIKWYRLAAEQGHAFAQSSLGNMYYNGDGVPQDYQEAVKWFHLAAEQGDTLTQLALGLMYRTGQGVSKNDQEAIKWYRLAAEQGHAEAQLALLDLGAPINVPVPDEEEVIEEQMPQLIGGIGGLQAKVRSRKCNIEGRVIVQFLVDENGNVSEATVSRGLGDGCDQEAIRVVSQHAEFIPGRQHGRPVKVKMTVPIVFKLR